MLKTKIDLNLSRNKLYGLFDSSEEIRKIKEEYELTNGDLRYHLVYNIPFCKHVCPVCKTNLLHVYDNDLKQGFRKTCSRECSLKSPERVAKILKTKADKVLKDCNYISRSNEKRKATNLSRYGTETPQCLESAREKMKQTCLKKYGTEFAFQSEAVKKKIRDANLKKYGVENPASLESVKQKTLNTIRARYGDSSLTSTAQLDFVKEKAKKTNIKRYGCENPMKSKAVVDKLNAAKLKTSYEKLSANAEKYTDVIPLFSLEQYRGWNYDVEYDWKCKTCGKVFKHYYYGLIPLCRDCHPINFRGTQKELYEILSKVYKDEILTDCRDIISPLELDFYFPKLKLAIEFNGTYWHSDEYKSDVNYHLKKTLMCEEKGIRLIHIWEYDWKHPEKQRIILSRIFNLLGVATKDIVKIFARKCELRFVETKEEINKINKFLDENHLFGSTSLTSNFAAAYLTYDNNLVAAMTFGKPRFNNNYQWELLRFCSLINHKVVGAASKLFKAFIEKYRPNNILSYADRCWSSEILSNTVYKALGFKFEHTTKPSYVYAHVKNDFHPVLSRYKCQKHKLCKLFGKENIDPSLTEEENLNKLNYRKIYDCGNLVYTLNLENEHK